MKSVLPARQLIQAVSERESFLSLASLKNAHRAWAAQTDRAVDAAGYVRGLDMNLMVPLCEESLRGFARGSGGESKARRQSGRARLDVRPHLSNLERAESPPALRQAQGERNSPRSW
jgi:hypothetical protein